MHYGCVYQRTITGLEGMFKTLSFIVYLFYLQFSGVPELMPFRMTRQVRNLMLPLQEKGLMEGIMTHALRALRNNSDLLMRTLDVFIKEPSLDWKVLHLSGQTGIVGVRGKTDFVLVALKIYDVVLNWFGSKIH